MKKFFLIVLALYALYYVGMIVYDLFFYKKKEVIQEGSFDELHVLDDEIENMPAPIEHTIDEVQEMDFTNNAYTEEDEIIHEQFSFNEENSNPDTLDIDQYADLHDPENSLQENYVILHLNEAEESNSAMTVERRLYLFNNNFTQLTQLEVESKGGIKVYSIKEQV